jgi:hypothetical protein
MAEGLSELNLADMHSLLEFLEASTQAKFKSMFPFENQVVALVRDTFTDEFPRNLVAVRRHQ